MVNEAIWLTRLYSGVCSAGWVRFRRRELRLNVSLLPKVNRGSCTNLPSYGRHWGKAVLVQFSVDVFFRNLYGHVNHLADRGLEDTTFEVFHKLSLGQRS